MSAKRLNIYLVEGKQIEPIGSAGAVVVCSTPKQAENLAKIGNNEGKLCDPLTVERIGEAAAKYKQPKVLFLNDTNY